MLVFVGFKVQPCGAIRVIEEAREANKVKLKHPDLPWQVGI